MPLELHRGGAGGRKQAGTRRVGAGGAMSGGTCWPRRVTAQQQVQLQAPRCISPRLPLLLLLLPWSADGQSGPHGKIWLGATCTHTRDITSSVTGCCNSNQMCPEDSSQYPGTIITADQSPDNTRRCICGDIPNPPLTPTCLQNICINNLQDPGEDGVDCGGICSAVCPCDTASTPPCACGDSYGFCPQGNTVEHWSCQDGCAPPDDHNYTIWCIERRHRHGDVQNLELCNQYPSSYPQILQPPVAPVATHDSQAVTNWPWEEGCWLSCNKMLYFKISVAILILIAVLKCMHKFKLGPFKTKTVQIGTQDELYEGNPNLRSLNPL